MTTPTATTAVALLSILLLSGCTTTTLDSPPLPADQVTAAADDISRQGGITAIGSSTTHTIEMGTMRSKEQGRINLAAAIDARVEALKQAFYLELETAPITAADSYFTAAAKACSTRAIRAAVPDQVKHETIDGSISVWSIFVQNPQALQSAFIRQGVAYRDVHARFQASAAYRSLQADIDRFNTFMAGRAPELP